MPVTVMPSIHAICRRIFGWILPLVCFWGGCLTPAWCVLQETVQPKPIEAQTPAVDAKDVTTETAAPAEPKFSDLLIDDLAKNWKQFSSKEDTPLASVWKLNTVGDERQLTCSGTPKGFLFTQKSYTNFELKFEWKYVSDPNGNSGVLVFTKNEPRLWPTSMQIQLHQPRAGCVFPSGDAISDNTTEAKDLALEIGKWNTCRVVAQGGRLSVEVNGKPAGEVSGCNPASGSIALQSEGSETVFRRMQIRELPAVATPAKETTVVVPVVEPAKEKSTAASGDSPATVDQ